MNSKTEKENNTNTRKLDGSPKNLIDEDKEPDDLIDKNIENICDDNLITLERIHAILINCINLSKKQKLEFAESERYFMKLYLKRLKDKLKE
ncbi:MAG: hypothetical protein HWN81_02845 [Candidatus Lokiarchaeota archaeon]|nr:hypothetical protein [Candidatus Lokiarchaeota archaeon]